MKVLRGNVWIILGLGLMLAFCSGVRVQAALAKTNKLIVKHSDSDSVGQLKAQGVKVTQDYGTYCVVEATDEQAAVLKASHGSDVTKADYLNRVELAVTPLDTTADEPAIPSYLRQVSQNGKNLKLIQFKGPVLSEWLDQVKSAGEIEIVSYVPNNAYIVWLDQAAESSINQMMAPSGPIQWIGAYHPYYKMDPALATVEASAIDVQVSVVNSSTVELTLQSVADYALEKYGQSGVVGKKMVMKIKVRPSDVELIAQMPDVLSIQRSAPVEKRDEVQDLILADRVSQLPGHGPIFGVDDYLDFLTNVCGFSSDATQYPIVDVADTLATYTAYFNDFFELGDSNNITRLAGFKSLCPPSATLCENIHGPFVMSVVTAYNDSKSDPVNLDASGFRKGLGVSPFGRISNTILFEVSGSSCVFCVPNSSYSMADIPLNEYQTIGARISNNSWGESLVVGSGGNAGAYDSDCEVYDTAVRDAVDSAVTNQLNQELITVFAGGNHQALGTDSGGYGDIIVTPPATAKNVIAVGASENVRTNTEVYNECGLFPDEADDSYDIAVFSSFGPTVDNRFKPEIVAPGAAIVGVDGTGAPFYSTNIVGSVTNFFLTTGNAYTCMSGTSFSSPAVSGAMQLLWWWFQHHLQNEQGKHLLQPSPAMAKAYLCNSARYIPVTNATYGAMDTLPSKAQGMGEMDLSRMFDGVPRLIRDESTWRALDTALATTNPVSQQTFFSRSGQSYEVSGTVADPTQPFRVTVAWTDAPGDATAFSQLVNDLDLTVTIGGKTYKGNNFVGSNSVVVSTSDNLNNMESVFLPAGQTGTWSVVVDATNIAGRGVPNVDVDLDQDFALVVYNAAVSPSPSDVPNLATNDTCQTAIEIASFPFTFTNTLSKAVYSNVHPSPSAANGGVDEFFVIEKPMMGMKFTIDTAGSGFDTVLSVWRVRVVPQSVLVSGPCGALVELVSNNDTTNGLQSQVSFAADGSNTYYVVVEPHNNGSGGTMVLNVAASTALDIWPSSLSFNTQSAGSTSAVQSVKFLNSSGLGVVINSITVGGSDPSDFAILSDICSANTLRPTSNCTISVAFTPTTNGTRSAQLLLESDTIGGSLIIPLSGVGSAPSSVMCLNTNSLSYGSVVIGSTSAVQSVTITNCGAASLYVTNIVASGTDASDYIISSDSCSGGTIAVGGTCAFGVSFAPSSNGTRSAVLTISGNTDSGVSTVSLTGTGLKVQPDLLISTKVKSKTFIGNQIYGTTGASEATTDTVKRGKKGVFYLAVQNDGSVADSFRIQGAGDSTGFTVKYYYGAKGDLDITDAVVAGTFSTSTLNAGHVTGDATMIRVEVVVDKTVAKGARRNVLVSGYSNTDGSKVDAVQAVVVVK